MASQSAWSLQWSPGVIAGETPPAGTDGAPIAWLQWSPGVIAGETPGMDEAGNWTGALQWSPGVIAGETSAPPSNVVSIGGLQWSPGVIAGETCRPCRKELKRVGASMEPRRDRRGNTIDSQRTVARNRSFNGAPA